MEITIILMLALFIFIIGILVALFVLIRKSMLEKEYQQNLNNYLDMIEDDEEEINLINQPIDNNDNKESNVLDEIEVKNTIKENKTIKKCTLDLVNVLINKKNYTFLSDGNKLIKNDKIKVKLQDKICIGIVIKGNYLKEFNSNSKKPSKIKFISKIDNKSKKRKDNKKEVLEVEEDFIPQKKRKKEE